MKSSTGAITPRLNRKPERFLFMTTSLMRRVKTLGLLLTVPLVWLLFRMFEPIFTWSGGWQPLPSDSGAQQLVSEAEPQWGLVAAAADTALGESLSRLQTPALSAAVAVNGQRVWAGALGMADLDSARAASLQTSFRLGSSSKAVNAIAMGRLMDSGRLDIDAPVTTYLPELPATYGSVTTRLAVSHRAGVPDYGLCLCFPVWEHKNRRHFESARAALGVFSGRPLQFVPGEGFQYSSYGTNVAGAVLESVSAQAYPELIEALVFKPLGMVNSRADIDGAVNPHRASFYEVTDQRFKLADPVDNSIRYPSGGLLSTPSDMLALGQVWLAGDFIRSATRELLRTPQKMRDGSTNPQSYALGMRVFDSKKLFKDTVSTRFYSHHGTAVGSTSYFAIYPEYRLVISVMMNKGQQNLDALAHEANQIAELFIKELRHKEP
jgi:CubicO group peptidase (beta-lactamase class C family)